MAFLDGPLQRISCLILEETENPVILHSNQVLQREGNYQCNCRSTEAVEITSTLFGLVPEEGHQIDMLLIRCPR